MSVSTKVQGWDWRGSAGRQERQPQSHTANSYPEIQRVQGGAAQGHRAGAQVAAGLSVLPSSLRLGSEALWKSQMSGISWAKGQEWAQRTVPGRGTLRVTSYNNDSGDENGCLSKPCSVREYFAYSLHRGSSD